MVRVKTRSYWVRLPEDLAQLLERDAARLRLPLSTYIRLKLTEAYSEELKAINGAKEAREGE